MDPLAKFRLAVYVVIGLLCTKELAKLVVLLVTTCCSGARPIPAGWRDFVRSSVFSPVLLLVFPEHFWLLFAHEATWRDRLGRVVHEGVCNAFVMFPLGLYYAFEVTKIGLTDIDRLALLYSGIMVATLLTFLLVGTWTSVSSACKRRSGHPHPKSVQHTDCLSENAELDFTSSYVTLEG